MGHEALVAGIPHDLAPSRLSDDVSVDQEIDGDRPRHG